MQELFDHDVRLWLTATQYAGLHRLAKLDDRPVSAYLRRCVQQLIDEHLDPAELYAQCRHGSKEGRL